MYESVWVIQKVLQDSRLDKLPGLPVSIHVMVKLSEATVPVSRDNIELVRVQGVRCEEVLEEVKPDVGFAFRGRID